MRRNQPIVALLTDFGSGEHYVGTVKAVMLSINPSLQIVDITHDIEPQNVRQASYLLLASYRYFPTHTVFVCVVDPGVGSSRRILGIQTKRYIFIAPDNGLMDLVLSTERNSRAYEIDHTGAGKRSFFLSRISSTFHARDILAPVAAHISRGAKLSSIGSPTQLGPISQVFLSAASAGMPGSILHIDRFGNIITNIAGDDEQFLSVNVKGIVLGGKRVSRWIRNYTEGPPNTPCMIIGSSGLVEIVIRNGNAARAMGVNASTPLRILGK